MTEQQAVELAAIRKMLESDGWAVFHKQQKGAAESMRMTSWESVKTIEQLNYMKGFLEATEAIVNYENTVDATEASWNQEANATP